MIYFKRYLSPVVQNELFYLQKLILKRNQERIKITSV